MGSRGVLLFRGTLSGHTRVEAKPRFLQRRYVEWGSNVFVLAGPSHLHNAVSTAWMAMPSRRGVGWLPPDQSRAGRGKDCTSGGSETVMENLMEYYVPRLWNRCWSKRKFASFARSICLEGTTGDFLPSFLHSFFLSPFNLIQFNFDKIDAALSVSRRPSSLLLLRDLFHVDARKIIARRKVFYRCVDAMLKREIELQTGWSGGF